MLRSVENYLAYLDRLKFGFYVVPFDLDSGSKPMPEEHPAPKSYSKSVLSTTREPPIISNPAYEAWKTQMDAHRSMLR